MTFELLLQNAALVAAMMGMLWVWSVVRRDASVVDPWWSIGFLLVTLSSGWARPLTPGRTLLAALVAIWALRLWAYLIMRSRGKPEDPRYQAFRARYGERRYWWVSLFQVFGLQGSLIVLLSAPLQLAMTRPLPDPVTLWDVLGAGLALGGIAMEAIADAQMAAFKRRSDAGQSVMDQGLWAYSRHPNYFGECLVWWGFWASSIDAGWAWLTVLSPLAMTYLLIRVSGVAMLEPDLLRRRPGYADYVARTPAFVPWPRRRK
jgi:steroid 5-alpha reductase family enzyme